MRFSKARKAQLSIEFLLVMAGFVFALALFAPVAVKASRNVLYALEIQKAKSFLSEFKTHTHKLSFFSDGTIKEIKALPLSKWVFSVREGTAEIKIKFNGLKKEHIIKTSVPASIGEFSAEFQEESILKMEKSNDLIILSLNVN